MEYTTNKKYKKPDLLDKVSVQQYNENFDAMDTNMTELEEKANTAVKNASDALQQIEAVGGKVMTSDTLGVGKVDGKTVGATKDGTLSVIAKASDIPATDSNNILENNVSPTTQALIDAVANKVVNELVTNTALTSTLANYMTKSLMSSQNADNTDMVPTLALTNAMQKSIDTLNSKMYELDYDKFVDLKASHRTNGSKFSVPANGMVYIVADSQIAYDGSDFYFVINLSGKGVLGSGIQVFSLRNPNKYGSSNGSVIVHKGDILSTLTNSTNAQHRVLWYLFVPFK